MEVERNREAKIDLYSSFVGWLTNAVERDGGEVESGGRARLTGKNQFVVEAGLNVERCRPRFIV